MARKMQTRLQLVCTSLAAACLASCTGQVPQTVQLPQTPPSTGTQPDFGRVVSIRPVRFQAEGTAEVAGVNAVLSALGQDTVTPPIAGEEIVIQKDDGNPAAIAQRSESARLAIGQRVIVMQGASAAIIGRN